MPLGELRAWIVDPSPGTGGSGEPRVFGLTARDRLHRTLERGGVRDVTALGSAGDDPGPSDGEAVVFRGDFFYDERVVAALLDRPEAVLFEAPDAPRPVAARGPASRLPEWIALLRGASEAAVPRLVPSDLVPSYNPALRKLDPPFVFSAERASVDEIEDRIFAASYKGLTDLVTKWVWPLPARAVTRWLSRRGTRPNTVTTVDYALAALTVWLFAEGQFGWGLLAGWLMTFLDTVDGKLARVTLTSTRFGHVYDHALDLVHPPIWWAAWACGLPPDTPGLNALLAIAVGGYLLGRLLEGIFLAAFKMEIFTWRRLDGMFRTVIARRNPNLLVLSVATLAGRPDFGFAAVAVWTAICNLLHCVRLAQAFAERARGEAIRPWNEGPSTA
ncbi:MAG: CDP-alcohol phosphatidyltransferase family protein [Proteobacteria bacterium]|nr:CDP-alcohol phosphatidyltransferase family protein [Pseudomonadota bacterium]